MSSSVSRISDLVRNFPERVLLGLGKRFFGTFAKDRDKVKYTVSTTPADSGTGNAMRAFQKLILVWHYHILKHGKVLQMECGQC